MQVKLITAFKKHNEAENKMETYNYLAKELPTPQLQDGATLPPTKYQIFEETTVVDPFTGKSLTTHRVVMTNNMTAIQAKAVSDAIALVENA